MTITALPTPPSRALPNTFADLGDIFLGALPAFATEANALEANVDALEAAATASAAAAAASAAAAAASAAADIWVSGTTYAIGDVAWSPANAQSYRRITAGAGVTDPSLDGTNWTLIYAGDNSLNRSARTSNTILGAADRGTLIDITSGTFTQTFTAAATLGAGWYCYLANTGTGTVTLDPNASELIDGAATLTLLPADRILIQCSGAAFYSAMKPEIPAQLSHSGKYLTTDGTAVSWGSPSVLPSQTGNSGKFITTNGTTANWGHVFATGTVMLFAQTAAPTGWTKSATHDNKALRVVSGTAGSGGTTAFTTVFASKTPAGTITGGATTLTESQMPSHYHFNGASSFGTGSFSPGGSSALTSSSPGVTSSAGGGGSHTHTDTFSGTAMDFAVQYVDVILATKD